MLDIYFRRVTSGRQKLLLDSQYVDQSSVAFYYETIIIYIGAESVFKLKL